jgi:3-hydroxyisobutyrate dehydrogenase
MTGTEPTGFIGLGTMGEPMALNLLRAGTALVVWNRSPAKSELLAAAGAQKASDVPDLFARCNTVILMMANGPAMDAVLARGEPGFAQRMNGHTVISMGTFEPAYSQALEVDILAAGGKYVEAPVSGSRKPAEAGELVAMISGPQQEMASIRTLIAPMCKECFECGPVPAALNMKLAVNVFLITMVTGLAEAANFAARHGLDINRFADILDAGPMASAVSRVKLAKLRVDDFTKQASITDVLKNNRLVVQAALASGIATPLMDICLGLYARTEALGHGDQDMITVIRALENRPAGA